MEQILKYVPEEYFVAVSSWVIEHGLKVAGILLAALIIWRFAYIFIEQLIRKTFRKAGRFMSAGAEKQREDTLVGIFNQVFGVAIWIAAALMILSEVGVDTAPLIAGAGIVGIAFGFGGQYLIKDLISGFFIILENQYRVGDVVCFGEQCGLVENINLRTTILRDLDGTVHHIPNGEIKTASNLSKGYARVNLDIGIAYDSDMEKVVKVVDKIGEDMAKDPEWKEAIITPPKFLRITDFADSAIIIKILGDTQPLKQWDVSGELRKRIKLAFDKNKIEIPFPQRVLHQKR